MKYSKSDNVGLNRIIKCGRGGHVGSRGDERDVVIGHVVPLCAQTVTIPAIAQFKHFINV